MTTRPGSEGGHTMREDSHLPVPPWRLPPDPNIKVTKCPDPPWRYHPPPLPPTASKPAAKQGDTMSKRRKKFTHQKRQLICPQCQQPTRRAKSRLVPVGKGYTVHGVTSYCYGHLCKACSENRQATGNQVQRDQVQAAG